MKAKNEFQIQFNKNGNKIDPEHIDHLGVECNP